MREIQATRSGFRVWTRRDPDSAYDRLFAAFTEKDSIKVDPEYELRLPRW
ncbi:hypothetical protein [Streptomyces sp. NPDC088254]